MKDPPLQSDFKLFLKMFLSPNTDKILRCLRIMLRLMRPNSAHYTEVNLRDTREWCVDPVESQATCIPGSTWESDNVIGAQRPFHRFLVSWREDFKRDTEGNLRT